MYKSHKQLKQLSEINCLTVKLNLVVIMKLLDLPNELLIEISKNLADDPKKFIAFYSSCRRLLYLLPSLIQTDFWRNESPSVAIFKNQIDLHKFAETKRLRFSCLKISDVERLPSNFIQQVERFREAKPFDSITKLHFIESDIDVVVVHKLLTLLPKVKSLSIDNCFYQDNIREDGNIQALKAPLKRLAITGDKTFRLSDYIFSYFTRHVPAMEFDISETRCVVEPMVIRRFYSHPRDADTIFAKPTRHMFTFPMVLNYLRTHKDIVRIFIARSIMMNMESLMNLITDKDLDHIMVDIRPLKDTTDRDAFRKKALIELKDKVSQDRLSRLLI